MTEKQGISDAVLLAIVSALSYGVAYAYQAGASSYFGLPPLLLSPTTGTILRAVAAVGLVLLAFWNFSNALWPFVPRGDSAIIRAIQHTIVIALIVGLVAFTILDRRDAWIVLFIVGLAFALLEFGFPLIAQRHIRGYENKLLEQERTERQVQKRTLLEHAANAIGERGLTLAGGVLLTLGLAYMVGRRSAKTQEEFFVLTNRPGYVIAAMDDKIIILAAYDSATRILTGTYELEQFSDSRALTLRKEHIGRLASPLKQIPLSHPAYP